MSLARGYTHGMDGVRSRDVADLEPSPQFCACRIVSVDFAGICSYAYCDWARKRVTGYTIYSAMPDAKKHLRAAMRFYATRWKFDGGEDPAARRRREKAEELVRELT